MNEHPTTTDGVWRVMRFENAQGEYAELASNRIGPEAVPVPKGYRFVRSTPMVPVPDEQAIERAVQALDECNWRSGSLTIGTRMLVDAVLAAALEHPER